MKNSLVELNVSNDLTSLLLQNVFRRLQQASERPEVQTGQGGTGSHGFRAERERRPFLQSSLCSFNFASVSSRVPVNAGDPARRAGDALQICGRERRESGGRAEGRETQAAERGRKFYDFSTSCAHRLHLTSPRLTLQLRSALDKVEELESSNSHLCKRMEKMKTSRGAAQTP